MRKRLTDNLGMKIISLGIAIVVWLIIVNTYDPVSTVTFRDIPVEILNEEAIRSLDQVYEVIQGKTVDVTVKGSRSVIDSLRPSDIRASADLSNISPTNNISINLSCLKSSAVELTLGSVNLVKISLENIKIQQFKISIVQKGSVSDGYFVGSVKAKPNLIQVSGAESQIERIDQVRVEIDVSNATEDFKTTSVPKAYDADGKQITAGSLVFSSGEIAVAADIMETKEIPLKIVTTGLLYPGYSHVNTEYEPQTVVIAGEKEVLSVIEYIEIPVDITNRLENLEESFTVADYLPAGVMLTISDSTVVVNLTIERMQVKDFEVPMKQIELRNLDKDYECDINQDAIITMKVQGLKTELEKLKLADFKPYIDLDGLRPGDHSITVEFTIPSGIILISSPKMVVTITDNRVPDNEEPTDQPVDGEESTDQGADPDEPETTP